jgi:hypothetical protein
MPQETPDLDHWEFNRETKDLIPLTVETLSGSTWVATTDYDVQCQRVGTRPTSGAWTNPTTIGSWTGYLVDGPVLDPTQIGGDFRGYYRLTAAPEDSIEDAFTLKLR